MAARLKSSRMVLLLCAASPFVTGVMSAQSVTISPGYTSIGVNQTLQYTATVTGLMNTTVTWSVSGVVGGSTAKGFITQNGLYTAPAAIPGDTTISALASDKKTIGVVYVNVAPAGPTITSVSPNPVPVGNATLTFTGIGFVKGATALVGGASMGTTFVSSTTLKVNVWHGKAELVPAQIANPGTLWGAVFNVPFVSTAPPPPQTISPTTASVNLGATQQFTSSGATSWTATAGTVSSAGLYTAPATMPASDHVTVTATGPGGSASASVSLVNPNAQKISPASVSLSLGATQQFTSAGATMWTATAGTVSAAGLYTAPATMPASNKVTVTATGMAGSASAIVTLLSPTTQQISPTSVSLNLGATQQFTSSGATSWTATAGTVNSTGFYTAPASMPAGNIATVTATGPGGSASATVTLINPNVQQIAPTSVSLNLGATQQFTSAGATSWTAVSGTVDTAGLYTAPAVLPASGKDTVTATGPNGTAQASVTLIPPAPVISSVSNGGQLPLGLFSATVTGVGFLSTSVAKLGTSTLTTTFSNGVLTVSGFASQSGNANLTVSNGAAVSAPFVVHVGITNAVVSAAAARRFLERSAFGPTPSEAAHVQTIGEAAWITEQFNMPQISNFNTITGSQGGMPPHFLTNAVSNPDQLRQRVAFALSQIFVTSIQKLIWNDNMVLYQNMLLADAFGNYRQIMSDVTLSPAMGQYLDMANNAKGVGGSLANENYARELMQLFTIGTKMLNQDGTPQVDSSNAQIPTYSQFTVTEFARVFTGWTYAPKPGQPVQWGSYISSNGPLAAYPAQHDSGAKTLLTASPVGSSAPAGLSPQADLDNALDNIFNHANMGPFVGKLLIQHLVKSNPTPAYVQRVATAFNGGNGVSRGDMKAVITAILMDPEATANDDGGADQPADGHLQEPALYISGIVRAFGGTMNDQNYYSSDLASLGQDLFDSPSVFNYYSPSFGLAGTALKGPEFQIHTPNNAIVRADLVYALFNQYSNPIASYGPGTTLDLSPFLPLASTPSTLVDALDLTLTHGVMPATMKSAIVTAVTGDGSGSLHRVQTACYLILTSSYYNVWH